MTVPLVRWTVIVVAFVSVFSMQICLTLRTTLEAGDEAMVVVVAVLIAAVYCGAGANVLGAVKSM